MKTILQKLLFLSLILLVSGCEKDPYPGAKNDEGGLREGRRREQNPPKIALSIVIPDKVNLQEGNKFVQKIRVEVPKPGKPIVAVDNLPDGAVFDPEAFTITWKPDYEAGNDLADPTIRVRRYNITVRLFTTEAGRENESLVRELPIFVYDTPRNFEVIANEAEYITEGETLSYDFELKSEDYPQGPFNVFSSDIPANSKIVKLSETKYRVVYTPDYHHVKLGGNATRCLNPSWKANCFIYVGSITALNPAGHRTAKELKIQIQDKRLPVKLSTPTNMVSGLSVSYSVSAVDPNGEISPSIELSSSVPEYGEFKTFLKEDTENNYSVLQVVWFDIPPSYNGSKSHFTFRSCVNSENNNKSSCDSQQFDIKIDVKERNAPVFERPNWEIGEIKFLKNKETLYTQIQIKDGDSFRKITKVEVLPKELQKNITYNNGYIEISGIDKVGLTQFTLAATSEYNVTSAESFVFEVFDSKRAKTLYFTDSTRDAEVAFYRDTLKNVELMNPVLQPLNKRNLSGRDTLIVGTGILADIERRDDIEQAMGLIKNTVIASPLIENMPEKFLTELQRDFRVSITGRYSDIANAPALKDMYFVARTDFQTPALKISLKLNTTTESFDPLIFSVGVDRENCQDVLDFTDKGKESLFKIGVICDRSSGGRFAILGTEFADLKTDENDQQVPALWLKKMLSTPLNVRSNK